MKYIEESLKKLKNDALSKGFYDLLKWLIISLILITSSKFIPYIKLLITKELSLSIYTLLIISVVLIAITTLIVVRLFHSKMAEVLKENRTDELTGLKNHKALYEFLNQKIQEYTNKEDSLSIIILDIDDFKNFNSEFGYNTADKVLRKLGELLGKDKRITDETFRYFYRGDEFLVVACDTTLSQAFQAAERKRKLIQKNIFSVGDNNYKLTVCCGVTELQKNDDYTSLTGRVSNALLEAKKIAGKDNTKSIV